MGYPSPVILRKFFEVKALGPDLGLVRCWWVLVGRFKCGLGVKCGGLLGWVGNEHCCAGGGRAGGCGGALDGGVGAGGEFEVDWAGAEVEVGVVDGVGVGGVGVGEEDVV